MSNKFMAMRSSNVEVQASKGGALTVNGKDFADFVKENLHTGGEDYTEIFRARIQIVIEEVESDFEFIDAAKRDELDAKHEAEKQEFLKRMALAEAESMGIELVDEADCDDCACADCEKSTCLSDKECDHQTCNDCIEEDEHANGKNEGN